MLEILPRVATIDNMLVALFNLWTGRMVNNNPSLSSCLKMSGHLPPDE